MTPRGLLEKERAWLVWRLTAAGALLFPLPCSLGLLDQFFPVVDGMLNVVLGVLSLERAVVVPSIEDAREESSVPDDLKLHECER